MGPPGSVRMAPPDHHPYRFCPFLTTILTVCVCTLTVGLSMLFFMTRQGKRDTMQEAETMSNTESTLPSNRAFVVQFRATVEQTQNTCAGRVEHLVSGQAVRFDSWDHLQQFIHEVLTKVREKPP